MKRQRDEGDDEDEGHVDEDDVQVRKYRELDLSEDELSGGDGATEAPGSAAPGSMAAHGATATASATASAQATDVEDTNPPADPLTDSPLPSSSGPTAVGETERWPRPDTTAATPHFQTHFQILAPPSPPPPETPLTAPQLDVPVSVDISSSVCDLPPHAPLRFSSHAAYERHYYAAHMNRCLACQRNFPSPHLLGLHIAETHDALAAIRRERGERTYACFLETCDRRCSTWQKRRRHLIDKHAYPTNFFWAITRDGIDGRRSLLVEPRRRHPPKQQQNIHHHSPDEQHPHEHHQIPRPDRNHKQRQDGRPADRGPDEDIGMDPDEDLGMDPDVDGQADGDAEADHPGEHPAPDRPAPDAMALDDLNQAMARVCLVPPRIRFGRGKPGFART